eukprot:scaffold76258_cov20-Tisochrysis_lutea.AAC.3
MSYWLHSCHTGYPRIAPVTFSVHNMELIAYVLAVVLATVQCNVKYVVTSVGVLQEWHSCTQEG